MGVLVVYMEVEIGEIVSIVLILRERKSRVTLAARLTGKTAAETISINALTPREDVGSGAYQGLSIAPCGRQNWQAPQRATC
jgi:hypothetical protein